MFCVCHKKHYILYHTFCHIDIINFYILSKKVQRFFLHALSTVDDLSVEIMSSELTHGLVTIIVIRLMFYSKITKLINEHTRWLKVF